MDNLEDFFSTPKAKDDKALTTDGIEELFDLPHSTAAANVETLDVEEIEVEEIEVDGPEMQEQLAVPLPPPAAIETVATSLPAEVSSQSINELLEVLAADLRQLSEQITRMADGANGEPSL